MCINTYSLIERVCVVYPSYILSAYRVRWSGYDRTGDTWEPITHLQGYASMVKAFNESHEKDVERLAADRRCGQNQKKHMLSKTLPNILSCA